MKLILLLICTLFFISCSHHGKKKWDRYDLDKDGKITEKEFQDAHLQKFKKLDKNGDGVLDDSEKKTCGK